MYQRRRGPNTGHTEEQDVSPKAQEVSGQTGSSWRRIVLLILAITIHNIPGESLLIYLPYSSPRLLLKHVSLHFIVVYVLYMIEDKRPLLLILRAKC